MSRLDMLEGAFIDRSRYWVVLSLDVCLELQLWRARLLRCRNSSHPSFSGSSIFFYANSSQASPSHLFLGASPAQNKTGRWVVGWLRRKRHYKDESRSFDIGNVPVLEAPSILTLYPTIPNNRCPLRYRCEGMLSRFFLLFWDITSCCFTQRLDFSSCPRLAALLACTLVLVCPSCGTCLDRQTRWSTCQRRQYEMPRRQHSHTRAPRRHLSDKKEPRS